MKDRSTANDLIKTAKGRKKEKNNFLMLLLNQSLHTTRKNNSGVHSEVHVKDNR